MKICRIVKLLCAVCITSFLTGCVSPYIGKTRQEIVDIIAQEYKKAPSCQNVRFVIKSKIKWGYTQGG